MRYEEAKQYLSSPSKFKRLIGITPNTFSRMLSILKDEYKKRHIKGGCKGELSLEDLLIVMITYLREYCTYERLAARFRVERTSLIRRVHWAEEVICNCGFKIKNVQTVCNGQVLIVDATEVRIHRPKLDQRLHYSGKKGYHTLKAQIITDKHGRILFVDFAFENCHDMKLFKDTLDLHDLSSAEVIYADKGYQGIEKIYPNATTPIKRRKNQDVSEADKEFNKAHSSIRIKVEHIFAKIKTFKIFSTTYRNRRKRFDLRFNLVAAIVNFEQGFALC